MTPFSNFYPTLRLLTGDNDPYGVFDNQDGQLDGALRSVFLLGLAPTNYELNDNTPTANQITPDITAGRDFALIAFESALLLISPNSGSMSYRTRALSSSRSGEQSRTLMSELKLKLHRARNGDDDFSSVESFATWLKSASLPFGASTVSNAPAPNFNVRVPDIATGL